MEFKIGNKVILLPEVMRSGIPKTLIGSRGVISNIRKYAFIVTVGERAWWTRPQYVKLVETQMQFSFMKD